MENRSKIAGIGGRDGIFYFFRCPHKPLSDLGGEYPVFVYWCDQGDCRLSIPQNKKPQVQGEVAVNREHKIPVSAVGDRALTVSGVVDGIGLSDRIGHAQTSPLPDAEGESDRSER